LGESTAAKTTAVHAKPPGLLNERALAPCSTPVGEKKKKINNLTTADACRISRGKQKTPWFGKRKIMAGFGAAKKNESWTEESQILIGGGAESRGQKV